MMDPGFPTPYPDTTGEPLPVEDVDQAVQALMALDRMYRRQRSLRDELLALALGLVAVILLLAVPLFVMGHTMVPAALAGAGLVVAIFALWNTYQAFRTARDNIAQLRVAAIHLRRALGSMDHLAKFEVAQ